MHPIRKDMEERVSAQGCAGALFVDRYFSHIPEPPTGGEGIHDLRGQYSSKLGDLYITLLVDLSKNDIEIN